MKTCFYFVSYFILKKHKLEKHKSLNKLYFFPLKQDIIWGVSILCHSYNAQLTSQTVSACF